MTDQISSLSTTETVNFSIGCPTPSATNLEMTNFDFSTNKLYVQYTGDNRGMSLSGLEVAATDSSGNSVDNNHLLLSFELEMVSASLSAFEDNFWMYT